MKHFFNILLLTILAMPAVSAQSTSTEQNNPSYAWTIIQPLGLQEPASVDTSFIDYSRRSVPSEISSAWACTGNLGAEGTNRIWMERRQTSDFFFRDALEAWLPSVYNTKFYNTRMPMTILSYNTGGGKQNTQDRLKGIFSGNINRRAQVGALLDYIYSKGSYEAQATKDLIWGVNGSYMGDRFEFQGFYNHYNMLNKENGGITDPLYITDPAVLQGGVSTIDPKAIPVRLSDAHSRIVGGQLLANARYKVGHWHEERDESDSVISRTYIPVTSFIYTLDYSQARHVFTDRAAGETRSFFDHTYLDNRNTYDKTTYYSVRNTVGVSLLEGFHRLAKFGLSAYFTHEFRSYTQTPDTVNRIEAGLDPFPEGITDIRNKTSQNLAWAGAQLTKQRGTTLRYEATAQLGLIGAAAGDVTVDGIGTTRFRLLGDTVGVTARVRFDNRHAPVLYNTFRSNHFIWSNDFGKERTLSLGGTLSLPHTGTNFDVNVQNIQNHIYFNDKYLPVQHNASVQVLSLRLRQNFHFRAWHWDNSVTYQTSGNESVIALPKLAVYTNMYAQFRIATLHMQLGIDCDWYTKYYAPKYQPATMSFANQNNQKLGNYPFMNLYANMRLSRARFYVMMSHINQGWFSKDYFSMPDYPLNPRRFQLGVSVDFYN